MLVLRRTPRWLPFAAVAAMLALVALALGPAHVVQLAARAARAPSELRDLPAAAAWSLLRLFLAYLASLGFAWAVAYPAATRPRSARVLLPLLDIGQSVPVLGFFPAAIFLFVTLLGGGRLAFELASVFLVFTSQVWNMAFGIYESLSTIPPDLRLAARSLGLQGGLELQRLLIPACIPRLVYNSIVSWSNGWYFLIASEILTVGHVNYTLPGLGSLLSQALAQGRLSIAAVALATIILLVLVLDFVVWRPLSRWAERFGYQTGADEGAAPSAFQSVLPNLALPLVVRVSRALLLLRRWLPAPPWDRAGRATRDFFVGSWPWLRWPLSAALIVMALAALWATVAVLLPPWPAEARRLPLALGLSTLRVLAAYLLALAWVVPVALWASESRVWSARLSLLAQVGASIPATAFFPVLVALLVGRFGGMEAVSVLLALTGMQWYLLFNFLSGVRGVPQDLRESLRSMGLGRGAIYRKLVLPVALPSLVTGSVAAWGGGWNALILSEYVVFRERSYEVTGVGALIDRATYVTGDRTLLLLSVAALVITVVLINRLIWQRLYSHVNKRYQLEGA